ncbi:hypothetical protein K493DRAFT_357604 [Basidiobolus meristosporus CBS 931.73]|uniref:RanBD1 domain-containing protein n=1 Tax=Basidiobolus meristosporus CBS 931.73 TaxID=1314790 RepID=A0A1Y1XVR6_9FUNG|nr:hypothetical protein K493DRAFT_357604 [Basidiobolus meristosporus CBS 931.73]|eukprot:ORX89849.1 hypothetical protein K493DRAFT_357604 [Basidiobolus meristosporus CBS 931.73]
MSKRGADKQLTQLNQHEEEEDVDQMSGFRQASADKLAARKIKKPVSRRSKAGSAASTPSAPSPFSGFSFGGTPGSVPAPEVTEEKPKPSPFAAFTFGTPSASTEDKESEKKGSSFTASSASFTFGAAPKSDSAEDSGAKEAPKSTGFTFGAANTSETKPDASIGFTFGGSSPSFTFGSKKDTDSTSTLGNSDNNKAKTDVASSTASKAPATFTFGAPQSTKLNVESQESKSEDKKDLFKHVRGLNVSFMNHVKKQIEINPFVDFSAAFEEYKTHHASIQKKFKESAKDAPKPSVPALDKSVKLDAAEEKKEEAAKPLFTFGAPPAENKSDSQPKPSFSFGAPAKDSESAESVKPSFTFGAPSTEKKSDEPAKPSFTFGAPSSSKPEEKQKPTFGFGSTSSDSKTEEKSTPAFTFGGMTPNTKSDEPSKPSFSFGGSSVDSSSTPKFSFGASTTTTPEKPSTGFTFGATQASESPKKSTETATTPTSTERKKTSISFGSALATSTTPSASSPLNTSSTTPFGAGFTFGTSTSPKPTTEATTQSEEKQDDGEEAEEAEEPSNPDLVKTGAGEEDETTIHEIRCKLYCWNKEKKSYADLGIGIFKMNENTTNHKKRFLVRTEGSGKVTLNVAVFPEMKIDYVQNKKDVSIIAVGEGNKPQKYLVRVKTPEQAAQLYKKIQDNKA